MSALMILAGGFLAATGVALGCVVLWLAVQAFVACRPNRKTAAMDTALPPGESGASARLCILIPAHDEEAGLAATLASTGRQLRPGDWMLVVADNCSDNTAAVARQCGATALERRDPLLRGKGYALNFGVRHLALAHPPDMVLVLDADCHLSEGALETLRMAVAVSGRPVQALDLMEIKPGSVPSSLQQRVSAFAWRVKNLVRARANHRLGLPCMLYGTGMLFPWAVLRDAPLASGHLVEDMQLGVALAVKGQGAVFCENASVTSYFPTDTRAARTQRSRWEHGHLQVIGQQAPRLLRHALTQGSLPLLLLGVDLSVPPLALLAVMVAAWAAACALCVLFTGWWWPAGMALGLLALFAAAVARAWAACGRDLLSLTDLGLLPRYVWQKLPIYFSFLSGQRAAWVRTARSGKDKPL